MTLKYKSIFNNIKVLITGHTGFKGSWLAIWLNSLGAKVVGVALEPPTEPSHFKVAGLSEIIDDHRIHLISLGIGAKSLDNIAEIDSLLQFCQLVFIQKQSHNT